jgi:DNA-binding NtrC family response regulator
MARILTVDDESFILMIIETLLTSEGYDVVALDNGTAAMALLRSDEPLDLMISDIRMSPVNGLELLKLAQEVRPDLPVIMVTAFHSEEAVADVMAMGATAYVRKPFKGEDILSKVKEALA